MVTTSAFPDPLAIYVHVPFCARRCHYCDFPTVAGCDEWIPAYFEALRHEITGCAERGRPVGSVYFGGGTPSHVPAAHIRSTLDLIRDTFSVESSAEITLEANPASAQAPSLAAYRQAGINRLSIGVQSFRDETLRSLGRLHSADEAGDAILEARSAGFDNVSVDLIFGCPGQSLEDVLHDVAAAIAMEAEHLSTYALTVEPSTPLADMVACGAAVLPDESVTAAMYSAIIDRLEAAGYEHYEVSNFALPGYRSRHNTAYWTDLEYIGFGAGSASYAHGVRKVNVRTPMEYVRRHRGGSSPVAETETLTPTQRLAEAIILGLRLREGIDETRLGNRFGSDILRTLKPAFSRQIAAGTIERASGRLRLTRRGLLIADTVLADLIPG